MPVTLNIQPEYSYVLIASLAIGVQYLFAALAIAGRKRSKIFTKDFMK